MKAEGVIHLRKGGGAGLDEDKRRVLEGGYEQNPTVHCVHAQVSPALSTLTN